MNFEAFKSGIWVPEVKIDDAFPILFSGPIQKSTFIKYIYRISQVKKSITAFQLAIQGSMLWQAPWTIAQQN